MNLALQIGKTESSKVLVPSDRSEEILFQTVSWRFKHVTLIICILAAGDALCSTAITANPISDGLLIKSLRQDEDSMIRRQTPPYINKILFYEYISTILRPYLQSVRENLGLQREIVIVLMNSCKTYYSEQILRLPRENKVLAIIFLFHIVNLF
jgi:hypothetical protein